MRRMRIERGLTQCQLAKASGYTERLIRKAEKSGRLDITTVQNLAEALSQFGENVSVTSLLQDNPATAELWVKGFDRFGKRMLTRIKHWLSDDFAFYCPGDPQTTPFAGTFTGAAGLQQWLESYFSLFARELAQDLEFAEGPDMVVARWMETCSLQGIRCSPFRISMCFRFRDGLITRIDNDYDTKACEDAILSAPEERRRSRTQSRMTKTNRSKLRHE